MKKMFGKLCYLIILFIIISGCQKEEMLAIENSVSHSIDSSYTGNEYNLQILYPKNYDLSLEYQTIYLLDGDLYFNELAEIVKSKYPSDIILIGIGYKNKNRRNTDYSYPADDFLSNSGGAKNYIRFLNNELLPFIEKNLSIKSSKTTLAGHSLGAYFALYQLFQQDYPSVFDNIIAVSPSLFWAEAYLLDLENEYHNINDTLNIKLYSTMGDLEGVTMNTMFDAFNKKIESRDYIGLSFDHVRLDKTSHNNNTIKSFDKGISFILN
ncbi:alpha/beta hydrolase [Aquimarina muelleri]|nr:alpha/beta hydrolase-fold protein [Aquimarina muelleri]MCX2764011.1 alpha/beta hydrolase-fold protein [Aquimarina muelleri]